MRIGSGKVCFAILCAVAAAGTVTGEENEVINKVLDAWKRRLSQVPAVRYKVAGTVEQSHELMRLVLPLNQQGTPPKTRPIPLRATLLLDLRRHRYRIDVESESYLISTGTYHPERNTSTWDGKARYFAVPPEFNDGGSDRVDLTIFTGDVSRMPFPTEYEPLFAAHGYVSTVNTPVRPGRIPPRYNPESFRHEGESRLNGRRCFLLRTEPLDAHPSLTDEIWVDPGRNFCVARHVEFSGSNPAIRIDTEFEQLAYGWVPKKWSLTTTSRGKVMTVTRLSVVETVINPALVEEDFTLPAKPGMTVREVRYPELGSGLNPDKPAETTLRIGPDGSRVVDNQTGFTTVDGVRLPPEREGYRWWVWAVATAVFIGLLSAAAACMKRKFTRRSG